MHKNAKLLIYIKLADADLFRHINNLTITQLVCYAHTFTLCAIGLRLIFTGSITVYLLTFLGNKHCSLYWRNVPPLYWDR